MPRGPQGQKRPADTIGCAITMAKIAPGELEPDAPMSGPMRSGKAMAAGVAPAFMSMADVVTMIKVREEPKKRGPYKKRDSAEQISN
jgi:hypothetical protein